MEDKQYIVILVIMITRPVFTQEDVLHSIKEMDDACARVDEDIKKWLVKFQNWWLNALIEKWTDFYFRKQTHTADIQVFKWEMTSRLIRFLTYIANTTRETIDADEDKAITEIEKAFHELIYDGEYDPWIQWIAEEGKQTPSVMDWVRSKVDKTL